MELVDGPCGAPGHCNGNEDAMDLFTFIPIKDDQEMALLSFAPAYHVLRKVTGDRGHCASPKAYESVLRKLSNWAHCEDGDSAALPETVLTTLDDLCTGMKDMKHKRRPSNMSNDTGYCSMEEGEMV